jgi:glutathione-regulated potassium-efflux system protein KefB
MAAVTVGGRYLLRPVFRIVASTQIAEVFTATALLVVLGAAWIMELAGIQMSLGAFVAGVLLADSEFRHEIESQIEPFKGLLLGLFFVSVGVSLDLNLVREQPLQILAIVAVLLAAKSAVLVAIGGVKRKFDLAETLRLAAVLAGGGEFAFVVLNLGEKRELLDAAQRDLLTVAVTVSMALTPLAVLAVGRWLAQRKAEPERDFDEIVDEHPRVILAGYGRVGQIIARIPARTAYSRSPRSKARPSRSTSRVSSAATSTSAIRAGRNCCAPRVPIRPRCSCSRPTIPKSISARHASCGACFRT